MAFKTSQRHFLKEKEAKKIILEFSGSVNVNTVQLLGSKPRIELIEAQTAEVFIINKKPILMRLSGKLLPTLFFNGVFPILPKVIVNMGAVPYVCDGADLMAPGVVRVDGDFEKNDVILIVDERFGRSLAIGVALFDSQTMRKLAHGKLVRNLHYVGDKLWNSLKKKFDTV